MKACKCGCTTFNCSRVAQILEDIDFDVETEDVLEVYSGTELIDTEFPIGPFICAKCNEKYSDYDDIPDIEDIDNTIEELLETKEIS